MLGTTHYFCFLSVIFFCTSPTSCQHVSDVKRLIKDKELNYDKSVRPVANQSKPITVYLTFDLLSIQEVDEVQQTITLSAFFLMIWTDEQMLWNPKDYGAIDQFTVESDRFWTPSLVLVNSNENIEKIGEPWLSVRYAANGQAFYFPGTTLKVSCPLDIRFYPWDRHSCLLAVSPWGYTSDEYVLINVTNEVGTSSYFPNGAWNIIGSSVRAETTGYLTSYSAFLFIERQPTYVLVNVIIPVIILSLLNTLIYFIPTDSGERMSFSITLLLAIAVFLTIVGDNLPKTSTPMAVLSFYLLAVLVISNCITLSVIYSLCLYHRDEREPVGGCWKRIVRVMKCQCTSRKRSNKYLHDKHVENTNLEKVFVNESMPNSFVNHMKTDSVYHTRLYHWKTHPNLRNTPVWPTHNGISGTNASCQSDAEEKDNEKHAYDQSADIAWKDVSVAFDRMCFVFFLLALFVAMSITFGTIYTGLTNQTNTEQTF